MTTYIDTLLDECKSCTSCRLHTLRQGPPVISRGNLLSKVMLIGEAPGENEEQLGKPFVGKAGEKLNAWFKWIGYGLDDIYITNICKCRPAAPLGSGKKNLTPSTQELLTCKSRFLLREIETINPQLLILCGKSAAVAMGVLKSSAPITPLFGTMKPVCLPLDKDTRIIDAFILRHPASLLYNQSTQRYEDIRSEYMRCFLKLKQLFTQHLENHE